MTELQTIMLRRLSAKCLIRHRKRRLSTEAVDTGKRVGVG